MKIFKNCLNLNYVIKYQSHLINEKFIRKYIDILKVYNRKDYDTLDNCKDFVPKSQCDIWYYITKYVVLSLEFFIDFQDYINGMDDYNSMHYFHHC